MSTTLALRNGAELGPDDMVVIEHRATGRGRVVFTAHASAACSGIGEGAELLDRRWADNTGDLFCPARCLDVATVTNWAAVYGANTERRSTMSATEIERRIASRDEAADRDRKARTRDAASEAQLRFLSSLLAERGLDDQDPLAVLYPSDNSARRRDGSLTKREASELIELLRKLPAVERDETPTVPAAPIADVLSWIDSLGRKVEAADLDVLDDEDRFEAFEAAALAWAAEQTGAGFEWLRDVARAAAEGRWETRWTKGVLNCMRAAAARGELGDTAPAPTGPGPVAGALDLSGIPAGYYAVPGGESRLKIRIDAPGKGKWAGWVFVKDAAAYGSGRSYGRQAPGGSYRGAIADELRAIVADPAAAAAEYGRITGRCGLCHRPLEDEESVARGIGPHCAKKAGW